MLRKPELPDVLLHEICLFAQNPVSELSTLSKAMNAVGYWKQVLKRDFEIPSQYCHLLTNGKQNPAKILKVVYQRLGYLKQSNPKVYSHYKNVIIDSGIDFLPLSSIGPSFPVLDAAKRLFYLYEAIRLKNTRLAGHILLQLPENELRDGFVNTHTIEVATEMLTLGDETLLRRMLPAVQCDALAQACGFMLTGLILPVSMHQRLDLDFVSYVQPPSPQEMTKLLNAVILQEHYWMAIKLLQKGAIPDTLQNTLFITWKGFLPDSWNLASKLLSFIPTHPALLNMPTTDSDCSLAFFRNLMRGLYRKADLKLAEAAYQIARQCSSYKEHQIAELKWCLLEVAVRRGSLVTLQVYAKKIRQIDKINLISAAMQYDQLTILHYLLKKTDKETIISNEKIRNCIRGCSYKNIVKYLIEDYRLFQLDDKEEKAPHQVRRGIAGYLSGLWKDFNNAIQRQRLEPVKRELSFLMNAWLPRAASTGNIHILRYFLHEAPLDCRLPLKPRVLTAAVSHSQEAVVRYLIEDCGMIPERNHFFTVFDRSLSSDVSLSMYLLSRDLEILLTDRMPAATFSDRFRLRIMHLEKPTMALNQVVDWLMGPEGKKCDIRLNLHEIIAHFLPHMTCSMLAWAVAKLKMKDSRICLQFRIQRLNLWDDFHQNGLSIRKDEWLPALEDLYLEACQAFYRQHSRHLHGVEASSSAVILGELKNEEPVEQKQEVVSQEQSGLSLAASASSAVADRALDAPSARVRYRR
jgi:hypothetical protein